MDERGRSGLRADDGHLPAAVDTDATLPAACLRVAGGNLLRHARAERRRKTRDPFRSEGGAARGVRFHLHHAGGASRLGVRYDGDQIHRPLLLRFDPPVDHDLPDVLLEYLFEPDPVRAARSEECLYLRRVHG